MSLFLTKSEVRRTALMTCVLVLLGLTPIATQSAFSKGSELPLTYVSNPLMHDLAWPENLVHTEIHTDVGHKIALAAFFVNHLNREIPYVVVFEIREKNGTTQSLQWQAGTASPSQAGLPNEPIMAEWQPIDNGIYEVRVFAISNFTQPELLGDTRIAHAKVT
jgi:hypothetical protein